ncbi:MAG: nuclear transport factor 2 family protein [Adlercreutzia equolifaciens]
MYVGDDRQDAAIGKPVYAEDSYVDFGTSPEFGEVFKGSGQEWAEYCANTIDKGITANGGYYAHQMYNIAITVNGTKAGSETYANAPVMSPNEDGTWHVLQTVARYCDKWEYRDGEWVIVERIVTTISVGT